MKISTFLLSICGFCIFYISYADWIDELYDVLVEDYLGGDYEEVAPFISSVAAGTEEFDSIVEQLSKSHKKTTSPYFVSTALLSLTFTVVCIRLMYVGKGCEFLKRALDFQKSLLAISGKVKELKETCKAEAFGEKHAKERGRRRDDNEPVQVIWRGSNLIESSIHCNLREDTVEGMRHRQVLQARVRLNQSSLCGGGDDMKAVFASSSNDSTMQKIAEMHRLLESESEIANKFVDKCAGTEDLPSHAMMELRQRLENDVSVLREHELASELAKTKGNAPSRPINPRSLQPRRLELESPVRKSIGDRFDIRKVIEEEDTQDSEDGGGSRCIGSQDSSGNNSLTEISAKAMPDSESDHKLMNRIRLLEDRLRLEELKNKNWISRMSRAEGLLQQLNKQVEHMEQSRPMEKLTKTLKITSTLTNWMPMRQPRANWQCTLAMRYPPQFLSPQYESLTDIIKREVCLPGVNFNAQELLPLRKSPVVPPSRLPLIIPQTSFLSKLMSK